MTTTAATTTKTNTTITDINKNSDDVVDARTSDDNILFLTPTIITIIKQKTKQKNNSNNENNDEVDNSLSLSLSVLPLSISEVLDGSPRHPRSPKAVP